MAAKRPKFYSPGPGDQFVKISTIGPQHKERIFEARNQNDGTGVLGIIEDANHYLLDGVVGIRFKGQPLGIFDAPDALVLLKAEGFQLPAEADQ